MIMHSQLGVSLGIPRKWFVLGFSCFETAVSYLEFL